MGRSISQTIRKIASSLIFRTEVTGHYSGQTNSTTYAIQDDKTVGRIDWVVFQGKPSIAYVEVDPQYRGKGIGKKLVRFVQSEYPHEEIEWGMMTGEGKHLYDSMKGELYVDKEKIRKEKLYESLLKKRDELQKKMETLSEEFDKPEPHDHLRQQMEKLDNEYHKVDDEIFELEKVLER